MSDVRIRVKDNLDALSERVLHEALVHLVRDVVREMRDVARGLAPKRTELLAEHIKDEEVVAVADMIQGRLGVEAVDEADDRRSSGRFRRSQYPMFVHGGTRSPIFPAKAPAMWNVAEGILGRTQVRGQKANPFMAETFAQAKSIIDSDQSIREALRAMASRAAAERAAVEI